MELDEMKLAWQSLDRRLEEHLALNKKVLLQEKRSKASGKLRPLVWGQGMQMIIGSIMALMAAGFWSVAHDIPHSLHSMRRDFGTCVMAALDSPDDGSVCLGLWF